MDTYPGSTDEAHPELFNMSAMPEQPKEQKPGQLSREEVEHFFREGYLVVENFFRPEELNACRDAIKVLVDDLAKKLHDAGKITKLYKDLGLFERLSEIEKECPGANIMLHKIGSMPQVCQVCLYKYHNCSRGSRLLGSTNVHSRRVYAVCT
eukprot:XP_019919563.1 PREDICTED: uncharacterized protein LOC105320112 [Crassostrea gigas]